MAKKNGNLSNARVAKNDEFYTQYNDIDNELAYYKNAFNGKTVFCNCDDPLKSNFTKYFILNFRHLGLKRLICTFYDINGGRAFVFDYDGKDMNNDGVLTEADIEIIRQSGACQTILVEDEGYNPEAKDECWKNGIYGSGDFRSKNVISYLKQADIIVTNPPFSLFREYIAQLIEFGKKFIVIGNMNAITYKEIFSLIKDNKLWLGITSPKHFLEPNGNIKDFGNILWFTNIEHKKRTTPIDLYKKYSSEKYLKYDNYDAIEVGKVNLIPCDYEGVMGVPITFLGSYCPSQFEILWQASGNSYRNAPQDILKQLSFNPAIKYGGGLGACVLNGKATYARILIKKIQ